MSRSDRASANIQGGLSPLQRGGPLCLRHLPPRCGGRGDPTCFTASWSHSLSARSDRQLARTAPSLPCSSQGQALRTPPSRLRTPVIPAEAGMTERGGGDGEGRMTKGAKVHDDGGTSRGVRWRLARRDAPPPAEPGGVGQGCSGLSRSGGEGAWAAVDIPSRPPDTARDIRRAQSWIMAAARTQGERTWQSGTIGTRFESGR